MSIKLISIDLDGTLLNSESRISQENKVAIKKCLDSNIKVVITTGKTISYVKNIVNELGLVDLQVVSNGSAIVNSLMEPVFVLKIPENLYMEVIEFSRKYKKGIAIQCLDGFMYYELENPYFINITSSGEIITKVPDLMDNKIVNSALMFTYAGIIEGSLFNNLSVILNNRLKIRRAGVYLANILNMEAGKVNAIKKILEIYNMNRTNVIAIGDHENDIGIIKFSGLGIAMGNSVEMVKSAADSVVADNDSNGVAEAIYKYVFAQN